MNENYTSKIIRSATLENMADEDGIVNPEKLGVLYNNSSSNTIITGFVYVSENGQKKKKERHNIKHIKTNAKINYTGKNNHHLRTEGSNITKKDLKERYPLSNNKENKENKTQRNNSSNKKERKNILKPKKNKTKNMSNNIFNNVYNNIQNKNEIKNEIKKYKKIENRNSTIYRNKKDLLNHNISSKQKTLVLDLDETLIYTSFEPSSDTDICIEIDLNVNEQ